MITLSVKFPMLTAMNNCREHLVGGDMILRGIANVKPTHPYVKAK
jgi:hypothetical protein